MHSLLPFTFSGEFVFIKKIHQSLPIHFSLAVPISLRDCAVAVAVAMAMAAAVVVSHRLFHGGNNSDGRSYYEEGENAVRGSSKVFKVAAAW